MTRDLSPDIKTDPTRAIPLMDRYQDAIVDLYIAYLKAARDELSKKYDIHLNLSLSAMVPAEVTALLAGIYALFKDDIEEVASSHTEEAYKHGIRFANMLLKQGGVKWVTPDYGKADWRALDWLKVRNLTVLEGMTESINQAIIREISQGMIQGESIREIAKRLEEIEGLAEGRAYKIARYETMFAVNQGTLIRYHQEGVKKVKWISAGDDGHTCETCLALDGMVFDINKVPELPQHNNCRCTVSPYIEYIVGPSTGFTLKQKEEDDTIMSILEGRARMFDNISTRLERTVKYYSEVMRTNKGDDGEGHWVTIRGTHVLIRDGETPEQAFKRTIGKSSPKQTKGIFKQDPKEIEKAVDEVYTNAGRADLLDTMNRGDLSKEDLQIIGGYQGADYYIINSHLRGAEVSKNYSISPLNGDVDAINQHIETLNSVIDKSPAPEGLALYRGVSREAGSAFDKAVPGDIIGDKGFQSFTSDPSTALRFATGAVRQTDRGGQEVNVVLQYVTGKGDTALPIMGGGSDQVISEFEHEFLLKPGQFEVMDVSEYTEKGKVTKVIQVVAA